MTVKLGLLELAALTGQEVHSVLNLSKKTSDLRLVPYKGPKGIVIRKRMSSVVLYEPKYLKDCVFLW